MSAFKFRDLCEFELTTTVLLDDLKFEEILEVGDSSVADLKAALLAAETSQQRAEEDSRAFGLLLTQAEEENRLLRLQVEAEKEENKRLQVVIRRSNLKASTYDKAFENANKEKEKLSYTLSDVQVKLALANEQIRELEGIRSGTVWDAAAAGRSE